MLGAPGCAAPGVHPAGQQQPEPGGSSPAWHENCEGTKWHSQGGIWGWILGSGAVGFDQLRVSKWQWPTLAKPFVPALFVPAGCGGVKAGITGKGCSGLFHGSKPCVTSGKSLLIPVPHWRNSLIPMVETTTAENEPQLMIPRSSEASWMSQLGTPRLWGQ